MQDDQQLLDTIKDQAKDIHQQVVKDRRHLHVNPELSFKEFETSLFVKDRLESLGIPWTAMADTGVVGIIKGKGDNSKVIALRADMDALPIKEVNDHGYISKHGGVMHACGHDAHTSSLLGTAAILQSMRDQFSGTIKLIFQPGEEKLPGGASMMIKEGVLNNPAPLAVIGQHVMPNLPSGTFAFREGMMMASMDELFVTVHGRGGHGAMPDQNIDPVLIAAQIVVSLQQLVSRQTNPFLPGVLSFGKLIADGGINIIPNEVYMEGTFRTIDEQWRTEAHQRMKQMASGIAESMGGTCTFEVVRGYPVLHNDPKLTAAVRGWAEEYLGADRVVTASRTMGAEDFSYYAEAADACFYFAGTGNTKKKVNDALHTPSFDIDEDALESSAGLMAWIAIRHLSQHIT